MSWGVDEFDLDGINRWRHERSFEAARILVGHPDYPSQRHDADIWAIRTPDGVVTFVAGDMSNLAWAFSLSVAW